MKKIIPLIALVLVAACNNSPLTETTSCTYSLENNEKTCNLSSRERKEMLEKVSEVRDNVKVIEGKSYREQPDGTLTPIQ